MGLDEGTGILLEKSAFTVLGRGSVTVVDGSGISYSNLVYRREQDPIAMFSTCVHVLPAGYMYDMRERQPAAPRSEKARR